MKKILRGAGLGLRREILEKLKTLSPTEVEFFEVAPENWLSLGGRYKQQLRAFTERFPFACHGLSLSIGSCEALDLELLQKIKEFLREHQISLYTEHLSWCSDDGHLYDLLPIPCTEEAVHWVAARIRQAQDILGMQMGIENASYYLSPPGAEMREQEFIAAVVREADCLLHLDVNNIYVNSQNFGFDPSAYLAELPLDRVCYIHVAGHDRQDDGLIIDTHGAEVIDPVWTLLEEAYASIPHSPASIPTCVERDFNFPALDELVGEVAKVRQIQNRVQARHDLAMKAKQA